MLEGEGDNMIHLTGKTYLVYQEHLRVDSDLILLDSKANGIDTDAERLSTYAGAPVSVLSSGKIGRAHV